MSWLAFLIACFLFLLATFKVSEVFTLGTVNLGLFFVALGLLISGAGPLIAKIRSVPA